MFVNVVSVGTAGYVLEELPVTCHAAAAVIHVRQTPAALGILQHIIHDWDDEPALEILSNCRQALQNRKTREVAGGRL